MRYDTILIGNTSRAWNAALRSAFRGERAAFCPGTQAGEVSLDLEEGLLSFERWQETLGEWAAWQRLSTRDSRQRSSRLHLGELAAAVRRAVQRDQAWCWDHAVESGVDVLPGRCSQMGPECVEIVENAGTRRYVEAAAVQVWEPRQPYLPFGLRVSDRRVAHAGNWLTRWVYLPRHITVIGAGQTGVRHARLFMELGAKVAVIDGRTGLETPWDLPCELGEDVIAIETTGRRAPLQLLLESGQGRAAEAVFVATGRRDSGIGSEESGVMEVYGGSA